MNPINLKKAFTLIELIVVISLIGIISSFAGANFLEFQRKQSLSESAQLLSTKFSKAFSLSRSRGIGFGIEVAKDQNYINLKRCDDQNCTNLTQEEKIEFPTSITIKSTTPSNPSGLPLTIKYQSPHGDIIEPPTEDILKIELKHKKLTEKKEIFIYRKSGLIEIKS